MCGECYADNPRVTPLLGPRACLQGHTQYICGHCGRCICVEREPKRGLQRWNFPFKDAATARLYLRAADCTLKRACGIYEITDKNGRVSCKIFADEGELRAYLDKNKTKRCESMKPVFTAGEYRAYPKTQLRRLTADEVQTYMAEWKAARRAADRDAE